MERLAAAWEAEGSDYLDPELAALCEVPSSRAPLRSRRRALAGCQGWRTRGRRRGGFGASRSARRWRASPCNAAQAVAAEDREALERLLRYGLCAPFSQERLGVREDGKVVYRLRRPWPNGGGATHLLLDPLDFLRRLAAGSLWRYERIDQRVFDGQAAARLADLTDEQRQRQLG